MADIPEQPAAWPEIPLIATTDPVLGGINGAANRQAVKIMQRMQMAKDIADTATAALSTLGPLVAAARTRADDAATAAQAALVLGDAAHDLATAAQTAAGTANTSATSASTEATNAMTLANTKATRIDLGTVSLTYSAVLAIGAGARSITVNCTGARVGDAIFVAATGAIPDGYAVGAAQCLVADVIRVSVVHPALVLGASFTIPLRVFALR